MTNPEIIFMVVLNIIFSLIGPKMFFGVFFIRKAWKWTYIIPTFVLCIWQIYIITHPQNTAINLIMNIIIIALMSIQYTANIYAKIGFSILLISIWTLVEFLVGYLVLILAFDVKVIVIYGSILSKATVLCLISGIRYFKERNLSIIYTKKYSWLIWAMPTSSVILMYWVFYYNLHDINTVDLKLSFLLVGILIFANFAVLKVYQLLISEFEMKEKETMYECY